MASCIRELNFRSSGYACTDAAPQKTYNTFPGTTPNDVLFGCEHGSIGCEHGRCSVGFYSFICSSMACYFRHSCTTGSSFQAACLSHRCTCTPWWCTCQQIWQQIRRRCYRRRMCTFSALHSLTLQKRKRIKSHNSTSTKSQGFQVHLDNPEIDDVWCDSFCSSWCSHLLPQCVFTSYIYSECKMHFMSTSSCNKLSPHRLRQCSFPRHSLSSIKRYFGRLRIGCFAPLLGDNSIED
mgnify:CR=1 FL=1